MGTTVGAGGRRDAAQTLPQAITFLNLPPSLLGPLQGIIFTGLVLVFLFVRPGGSDPAAGSTWTASTMAPRAGSDRSPSQMLEVASAEQGFGGIVVADNIDLSMRAGSRSSA